ncbi:MAG: LysR family transcriptional regulator [Dehalococcoidia bacterium]
MFENVTLTQLRALVAVARTESFTQAAIDLDYTTPAVHHQIRALERALGLTLVRRNGGSVVITREAEELLPHVEVVLDELGTANQKVRSLIASSHVVLGAGENAASYLLMPLLGRESGNLPTQIDLRLDLASNLIELVRDGEVDIAVSSRFRPHLGRVRRAGSLRFARWVTDYILLVRTTSAIELPTDAPIFTRPTANNELLEAHLKGTPYASRKLVPMATGDAARTAARHGFGLAMLPASSVIADVRQGALQVLHAPDLWPLRVQLVHRCPSVMGPAARSVLLFLLLNRPVLEVGSLSTRTIEFEPIAS